MTLQILKKCYLEFEFGIGFVGVQLDGLLRARIYGSYGLMQMANRSLQGRGRELCSVEQSHDGRTMDEEDSQSLRKG